MGPGGAPGAARPPWQCWHVVQTNRQAVEAGQGWAPLPPAPTRPPVPPPRHARPLPAPHDAGILCVVLLVAAAASAAVSVGRAGWQCMQAEAAAAAAERWPTFLVLGDWGRRGGYNQTTVAAAMARKAAAMGGIDFVVSTGGCWARGAAGALVCPCAGSPWCILQATTSIPVASPAHTILNSTSRSGWSITRRACRCLPACGRGGAEACALCAVADACAPLLPGRCRGTLCWAITTMGSSMTPTPLTRRRRQAAVQQQRTAAAVAVATRRPSRGAAPGTGTARSRHCTRCAAWGRCSTHGGA